VYIKCVLSQTLAHLRLEVAVDTRRVDGHFALVCIHEEGLSSHLQVGQGRDEYFVLDRVLRLHTHTHTYTHTHTQTHTYFIIQYNVHVHINNKYNVCI
jgi:hypothetical protein